MIPFFHATSHNLYAKSAHLYLQNMREIKNKMNTFEYDKFANDRFFTIRRSDKFWSGIWSDMTIEQVLMKSMKSQGGLTHGRGITQTVLNKWILSMIAFIEVCNTMEQFCNVSYNTSKQHIDTSVSSILRDTVDLNKLLEIFQTHEPFPLSNNIMSISRVRGSVVGTVRLWTPLRFC